MTCVSTIKQTFVEVANQYQVIKEAGNLVNAYHVIKPLNLELYYPCGSSVLDEVLLDAYVTSQHTGQPIDDVFSELVEDLNQYPQMSSVDMNAFYKQLENLLDKGNIKGYHKQPGHNGSVYFEIADNTIHLGIKFNDEVDLYDTIFVAVPYLKSLSDFIKQYGSKSLRLGRLDVYAKEITRDTDYYELQYYGNKI